MSKWKKEALFSDAEHLLDISKRMFKYCIAELQYKAETLEDPGVVVVFNGDVVKSDTAIPASLKEALRKAISPLENVPTWQQDWHPGSEGKVLNLVHPSLFPLIYERSRILPDSLITLEDCIERCGEGVTVPIPPEEETTLGSPGWCFKKPFSQRFQWLPCDIEFFEDDPGVR